MGAQPVDVLRLVLKEAATMAVFGVLIGAAAAFGLTRLMARVLLGVSAYDPLTFVCVPIVLIIVSLFACYISARRAMKVKPMITLRYE